MEQRSSFQLRQQIDPAHLGSWQLDVEPAANRGARELTEQTHVGCLELLLERFVELHYIRSAGWRKILSTPVRPKA